MTISPVSFKVRWEKLPDDFVLDDQPVDNINQPSIAAALTESLELAGKLSETTLTPTNYAICATLNDRIVVKAPDWGFVPAIRVPQAEVKRSYTPQLQGDMPAIVMEFLSDTEGGEYSNKPTYPPGKWFFYEHVLKVPVYAIFEPESGVLEVYRLDASGHYQLQPPDTKQRHWIAEIDLALGVWQGSRAGRTGYWLRWWNAQGELLLWGTEQAALERQRAEQERSRAEQERSRADRLAEQLRAAGIEPQL